MSTVEDMAEHIVKLNAIIRTLHDETSSLEDTEVTKLCLKYQQLREFKDALESATEQLTCIYNKLGSEDLPACFEKLGLDSVKIGGRTFTPSGNLHFSIREDREKAAHTWLIDHGLSAIIKEKVNSKTLTAALKEHFIETMEMPPSDVISSFTKKTISVRRS